MDYGLKTESNGIPGNITNDLEHDLKKKENTQSIRSSRGFMSHVRFMVSCGGMGLVLLTVLFLNFACTDERSREELNSIKPRLEQMEKRLAQLEGTTKKITGLEGEVRKLNESVKILNGSLSKKVKGKSIQKKSVSPIKKAHHVVRRGESLFKIAKRYGLTVSEICRLNQITPKTVIRPGQKLIVSKAASSKS